MCWAIFERRGNPIYINDVFLSNLADHIYTIIIVGSGVANE
jgi:hypothetical protein